MSKSNVTPNHSKVAGRERQGEDIVQARSKQKPGPRARSPKAAPGAALRPRGAAPQLKAKQETKRTSVNPQSADKRGKRSTAKKRASSRQEFDPIPATNAVARALGTGPSPRRLPMRK